MGTTETSELSRTWAQTVGTNEGQSGEKEGYSYLLLLVGD